MPYFGMLHLRQQPREQNREAQVRWDSKQMGEASRGGSRQEDGAADDEAPPERRCRDGLSMARVPSRETKLQASYGYLTSLP